MTDHTTYYHLAISWTAQGIAEAREDATDKGFASFVAVSVELDGVSVDLSYDEFKARIFHATQSEPATRAVPVAIPALGWVTSEGMTFTLEGAAEAGKTPMALAYRAASGALARLHEICLCYGCGDEVMHEWLDRTLSAVVGQTQIAEVCEDADGTKHVEAVIEDLDDVPAGTKLFAGRSLLANPTADTLEAVDENRMRQYEHVGSGLTLDRCPCGYCERTRAILAAPTPSTPAPVAMTDEQESAIKLAVHYLEREGREDLTAIIQSFLDAAPPTRPDVGEARTQAATDVLEERERQVTKEGWTPEHDDKHTANELSRAAACYAYQTPRLTINGQRLWPWDMSWWKDAGYRRCLVKSGALILAEIERIDRASTPTLQGKEPT